MLLWSPRFSDLLRWQRCLESASVGAQDEDGKRLQDDKEQSEVNGVSDVGKPPAGTRPGFFSSWKRYLGTYFRKDSSAATSTQPAMTGIASTSSMDAETDGQSGGWATRPVPISCRPPSLASVIMRQGIPDCFRGIVWTRLTEAHIRPDKYLYKTLTENAAQTRDMDRITKDMHRTFPGML